MFIRTTVRCLTAGALIALPATTAACGGSGSGSGSAATTTAATVTAAVTESYERFFDGGTEAGRRQELLENGRAFADTLRAQADSPGAGATTATVSGVAGTGTDHADVIYTVLRGGRPILENQQGAAVHQDGNWKVTATTFCALLVLQGTPPPICATTPPPR